MAYKNKEDQAKAARKHYLANLEKVKERSINFKKEARNRNKEYVDNYLREHSCVDCGEKDIIVLEFDHVKGNKEDCISSAAHRAWSLEKLKDEINKCEVRCANCHRRITYKRRLDCR